VILPDTNLLLYAYNSTDPRHTLARNWFKEVVNGSEPVAFCWPVILGFLRVSTNQRAFLQAFEIAEAIEIVNRWLRQPNSVVIAQTERHWVVLSDLLIKGQVRGPVTTDAEIAALAVEHGATVYSADRDFLRFPNVTLVNPLGS
jgi:toxin-antitoxin system PIN domain toxin